MTDIEDRLVMSLDRRASNVDVRDDLDTILSGGTATRLSPASHRKLLRTKTMAAAAVLIIGAGGLVWMKSIRSESSTADGPIGNSRQTGAITDPKAIDLSTWIDEAPLWPTGQPNEYLIFDIAALGGWTQVDQTGGHQIGAGAAYQWFSNVTDPDGRQFNLSIRTAPDDSAAGEPVDINGRAGNAGDGQVSWAIDGTHTATVAEFGTAETDRAVALAQTLTTMTVPTISTRQPSTPTGITVDPDADFAGTVEGIRWSATATRDSVHFILDDIADDTVGMGTAAGSVSIVESGGNDACVFVAGLLPTTDAVVRLVLSTDTTIALPTQPLNSGNDWFAACVPYQLDAVALDITVAGDTKAARHPLQAPYLIPTIGSAASFAPPESTSTQPSPATTLAASFDLLVPSGLTAKEIGALLGASSTSTDPDEFVRAASDAAASSDAAPDDVASAEGLLAPGSYTISQASSETEIALQMITSMNDLAGAANLDTESAARGRTPYEIMIIASMIEREAKVASDLSGISRVIHNRLFLGMPLQIDSTVLYGGEQLGLGPDIPFSDLRSIPSDWNTYLLPGLPSTPISNPSAQAINAALHPRPNPEPADPICADLSAPDQCFLLYYVIGNEDGTARFAATPEQHSVNVEHASELGLL